MRAHQTRLHSSEVISIYCVNMIVVNQLPVFAVISITITQSSNCSRWFDSLQQLCITVEQVICKVLDQLFITLCYKIYVFINAIILEKNIETIVGLIAFGVSRLYQGLVELLPKWDGVYLSVCHCITQSLIDPFNSNFAQVCTSSDIGFLLFRFFLLF